MSDSREHYIKNDHLDLGERSYVSARCEKFAGIASLEMSMVTTRRARSRDLITTKLPGALLSSSTL